MLQQLCWLLSTLLLLHVHPQNPHDPRHVLGLHVPTLLLVETIENFFVFLDELRVYFGLELNVLRLAPALRIVHSITDQ